MAPFIGYRQETNTKQLQILKLFIEHNGDMNVSSGIGWTALHYAGQANNADCVEVLLAAGADAERKNHKVSGV